MTRDILKNNVNLAYTTNTYGIYGKKLSNIIGINNYSGRQKIDVICSTIVTDNTCIQGTFSLQPKIDIIEKAYISMHIRLLGDKTRAHIHTNVTTNNVNQNWKKLKYINNPL